MDIKKFKEENFIFIDTTINFRTINFDEAIEPSFIPIEKSSLP